MKYVLLLIPAFTLLSFNRSVKNNFEFGLCYSDTSRITHVLDGNTNEWPDSMFQVDKETSMHYAMDNDAHQLYLALRIPDFRTQMKMMRQGMNLYIDLKGKKKEGRGIEFPIKPEAGSVAGAGPGQGNNGEHGNFNKQAIRESMAVRLIVMKLFGFTDDEPKPQGLQMEGSAKIGFIWDSADVMHVEYVIPFSMLGDAASLHQKTVGIGWKINGIESSSSSPAMFTTSSSVPGRASPGGINRTGGAGRGATNYSTSQPDMQGVTSEQSVWTKYTISF